MEHFIELARLIAIPCAEGAVGAYRKDSRGYYRHTGECIMCQLPDGRAYTLPQFARYWPDAVVVRWIPVNTGVGI